MTHTESIDLGDLRSVEDLAAEHPRVLSVATLRNQLRQREKNGLSGCCVPVGRRLMIIKPRYEAWLASRAEVSA